MGGPLLITTSLGAAGFVRWTSPCGGHLILGLCTVQQVAAGTLSVPTDEGRGVRDYPGVVGVLQVECAHKRAARSLIDSVLYVAGSAVKCLNALGGGHREACC